MLNWHTFLLPCSIYGFTTASCVFASSNRQTERKLESRAELVYSFTQNYFTYFKNILKILLKIWFQ